MPYTNTPNGKLFNGSHATCFSGRNTKITEIQDHVAYVEIQIVRIS